MRLDAWRMLGALVAYQAFMHQKACDQWPWPAGQSQDSSATRDLSAAISSSIASLGVFHPSV
ncbi:hypothetical protein, partial [Xanthomonas oryzae]|uniref:hypothetical protein n=1 Tax=Xanthomonas oryzae TaxID=347 RepID=UPI001C4CFF74